MRTFVADTPGKVGETVTLKGWVNSRRDHGGLIFIDVRDHTGVAQLTIHPEHAEAFTLGESLRDEFVISATGKIVKRGEGLTNPNIATGSVEIIVEELAILNRSEALPIQISSEGREKEDLRLRYRYLDLRRPKMQAMLAKRADMYRRIRLYMEERDFTEVTTPIIANSSPEGARDFLIPSRLQPGKFYALPQAPQQFKQLLMVGGVPRYYQLAACFRDEDPRADRLYGEFYQLDLEMSFVEDGEEVRATMEPLIKSLVKDFAGKKLLTEDIRRIPYNEAMEKYGTDKPDLRYGLELVELKDELRNTEFNVFKNAIENDGTIKAIAVPQEHHAFTRAEIDELTELAKSEGAGGLPVSKYEFGDFTGGITKFLSQEERDSIQQKLNITDDCYVFFGVGQRKVVNKVLGKIRSESAARQELAKQDEVALAWIVDFPFYETDEKTGKLDFSHNPFSMPKGGMESLNHQDKLAIVADQYDMVMNGYEICSGGVRNHNPEVMYKVFGILGFDEQYVNERFGAMINAFKFGAPPHAGCAFGVDRILMELIGENNVREVVAFPKNGSGVDVMMNSPSPVEVAQLDDLNLRIIES